jgi:hypothetical protein
MVFMVLREVTYSGLRSPRMIRDPDHPRVVLPLGMNLRITTIRVTNTVISTR